MKDAAQQFAAIFHPPRLKAGGRVAVSALVGAADAFVAAALTRPDEDIGPYQERLVLAITPGIPDAERLADDLRVLSAKAPLRVLELPPKVEDERGALGERLKTLAALRAWSERPYPAVLVASYAALVVPVPKRAPSAIVVGAGAEPITMTTLGERLATAGYRRVPQVEDVGDFAIRGGILDAWSPGEEFPVRAEFFGDDLEGVRSFDPATQISIERLARAELLPVSDGGDDAACRPRLQENDASPLVDAVYRPRPRENDASPLVDAVYRPRPAPETDTLWNLLPDGAIVLALNHNDYSLPFADDRRLTIVFAGDPAPAKVPNYAFQSVALPGFAELGSAEAHHPELFESARKRLEQHLAAAEKRGMPIYRLDDLSGGFETEGMIVVAKSDRVFAKRKVRQKRAAESGARLNDFDTLEPGEYVVHVDHGVGRYIGSSEIVTEGRRTEVFTIEYADGAKLHVPATHAHLLSRYVGVKGESVRLHRLDGKRWQKDKADAQKAVADLAVALLETQARRAVVPGFAYDVNCEGLDAFEAAFPYEETPDQTAAIAAIKRDLAATKPMDRLICGDAGYGKTEVAMRAAYIAAMNGKQVAVLAPTTVLAEQHFETFTSRFDGTPVRIESVSRFQGAATHAGTFARIASGACDIVIGTHAILSSKIAFHDLGLIIIDEEQRFGVRHKEFLKRLRATADVLTLSATPIPRTLYLSMTGARDLSLLRTPPHARVAVDTKVVTDSDLIVRAAIEAEIARGGQVFFLHNRVSTIGKVQKRLEALFPQTPTPGRPVVGPYQADVNGRGRSPSAPTPRIVVAHGQMDARTLALKMRDFERGKYDILLSTTIVESGIDIPRANTILVDHAEMFGLADLYQLRGRVGRSSKQGHAVFLLPTGGLVDSDARERLDALKRHGGLGSGFNLAVRDLELRGAGNLLGSQQSGHIAAVGFNLYCQLLQRTISTLKGEKPKEIVDVRLNLDFVNPVLPYEYVEDDTIRLSLLRRFAEAQDERTVNALSREMKDRFGPLPDEARTFVRIALLRVRCAEHGIGFLDTKETRAIAYRNGTREIAWVLDLKGKTPAKKLDELLKRVVSSP